MKSLIECLSCTRALLCSSFVLVFSLFCLEAPAAPYAPGEVLVTLSPKVKDPSGWLSSRGLRATAERGGGLRTFPKVRWRKKLPLRVQTPAGQTVMQTVAELKALPGVVSAQPNYIYRLYEVLPNDTNFGLQWALRNTGQTGGSPGADIEATTAWEVTTGSADVVVAVIDTGADLDHPDLATNLWRNPGEIDHPSDGLDNDGNGYVDDWRGWDFHDNDNDPTDDHSHGSHVSGTIGAVGNNFTGVCGVCWTVKIMPLDAFDTGGESFTSNLVEAVVYAGEMGARIINASWGDQYYDLALLNAMRDFAAAGGVICCAAGNEYGEDNDRYTSYPANFDVTSLISVGASTEMDSTAGFSSIGRNTVHLFAPGTGIRSLNDGGGYTYKEGTSMATPHVAGVAALLWSWDSSLTPGEVKYRILGGTEYKLSFSNNCLSQGRLSAARVFGSDFTAPNPVVDLAIDAVDYDRVVLSFTATGDNGNTGTARFYDIRYSHSIISESNWEMANRVRDLPLPAGAGNVESVTVSPLDENTQYYFRMKVIDESGNHSPLSNQVTSDTIAPMVLFSDDVETGDVGWTIESQSSSGQQWQRTNLLSRSGQFSWSDSPGGTYNEGNFYLISPQIDLSQAMIPVLRFWHRYDIEPEFYQSRYDFGEVQVSTDGQNWSTPFEQYYDGADWWMLETLELSDWSGQTIQIRFHLQADAQVGPDDEYEGWTIDDIRVLDLQQTASISNWAFY